LSKTLLRVKLPPEHTLLRDLVLTSLAVIKSNAQVLGNDIEMRIVNNEILAKVLGSWDIIIGTTIKSSIDLLNVKVESGIRAPKLHQNDYSYIFKKLITGIAKNSTYIDAFNALLSSDEVKSKLYDFNLVNKELSTVSFTAKKGAIKFGLTDYPLPQIFKVEIYEKGLTFHKLYTLDFSIRLSDVWLSLIAIGFIHSYGGSFDGKLSFITIGEEGIYNNARFNVAIMTASTLVRTVPDPIIPYLIYTSLKLPDIIIRSRARESRKDLEGFLNTLLSDEEGERFKERIKMGFVPPLILHILGIGRAYTALMRVPLEYSSTIKFSYIIDDVCKEEKVNVECRNELSRIVELGLGGREPKVVNALTLLYEAINGAKDPALAMYVLLRTIKDIDLNEQYRRIRLSRECVNVAIKAMERSRLVVHA